MAFIQRSKLFDWRTWRDMFSRKPWRYQYQQPRQLRDLAHRKSWRRVRRLRALFCTLQQDAFQPPVGPKNMFGTTSLIKRNFCQSRIPTLAKWSWTRKHYRVTKVWKTALTWLEEKWERALMLQPHFFVQFESSRQQLMMRMIAIKKIK